MGTETHYLLAVNELAKLHLVPAEQNWIQFLKFAPCTKKALPVGIKRGQKKTLTLFIIALGNLNHHANHR